MWLGHELRAKWNEKKMRVADRLSNRSSFFRFQTPVTEFTIVDVRTPIIRTRRDKKRKK